MSLDLPLQTSTEGLARPDDAILGNRGEGLSNGVLQGRHTAVGNSADLRLHLAPEEVVDGFKSGLLDDHSSVLQKLLNASLQKRWTAFTL